MKDITPTPIHLLYVPTLQCNLGCRYCYLGHETDINQDDKKTERDTLTTLTEAVERFQQANYLPFNISLHGGEVTTLPAESLELLFDFITRYYQENNNQLKALGFTKSSPHVKTNLLNFHTLIPLFEKYKVSVSASIDLPLSLHKKYRTTKKGGSSMERIVTNLKLLASYPYNSKISTTLFRPHFLKKEELARDIKTIHREYGFDMRRFNIMFGFESAKNREKFQKEGSELPMMTEEEQVELFHFLTEYFTGTELEPGLKSKWFEEFTPSYCTNSFNCGEKFFLLQADGSIYSCVRGQGTEEFRYGNIFQDDIEEIVDTGRKKISYIHKRSGFHADCQQCEYLQICHTGCPFVKSQTGIGKSYTCRLQKELYLQKSEEYPAAANEEEVKKGVLEYASDMHPNEVNSLLEHHNNEPDIILPGDFYQEGNSLKNIIAKDSILKELYRDDIFLMTLDDQTIPLQSQLLKPSREIYSVSPDQQITLHIRKNIFQANCPDSYQNCLYLQMLRNTKVVYGDEQRTKQEHTFTHQVYWSVLTNQSTINPDFLALELTGLFQYHASFFMRGVLNNLFITTSTLREYHYKKQKNNGFYHIQALNLPFQNFEFYWG